MACTPASAMETDTCKSSESIDIPSQNIASGSELPSENVQRTITQPIDMENATNNEYNLIDLEKDVISSSEHHDGTINVDNPSADVVIGTVNETNSFERGKSFCLIKNVKTPVVNLATPSPSTNRTNLRSVPLSQHRRQSPRCDRNIGSAHTAGNSYDSNEHQQNYHMQQSRAPTSSQEDASFNNVTTSDIFASTLQRMHDRTPSLLSGKPSVPDGYTNKMQTPETPNSAPDTVMSQQGDQSRKTHFSFQNWRYAIRGSQPGVANNHRGNLDSSSFPTQHNHCDYPPNNCVHLHDGGYIRTHNNNMPQITLPSLHPNIISQINEVAKYLNPPSLNYPSSSALNTGLRSYRPEDRTQPIHPNQSHENRGYSENERVPFPDQPRTVKDERYCSAPYGNYPVTTAADPSYRRNSDHTTSHFEAVEYGIFEEHISSPLNDVKEEPRIPRHQPHGNNNDDTKQDNRSPCRKEKGFLSEPAKQILSGNRNSIGDTKDGVISIPRNNSPSLSNENIADLPSTQLTVNSTQEELSDIDSSIPLGGSDASKREKRKLQKTELNRIESPKPKRKRVSVFDCESDKEEKDDRDDPSVNPDKLSSGKGKNGKEQTSTRSSGRRKKPSIKTQLGSEKKALPTSKIGGTKLLKKPVQKNSPSYGKPRTVRGYSQIEDNRADNTSRRRSTRLNERNDVKQRELPKDLNTDTDDDDFEISQQKSPGAKCATRKPRKVAPRTSPTKKRKKTNTLSQITGPNEESRETEVEECNPSQEPANDEIVLNFGAIRPRKKKKKQTSLYPDSVRKKMSSDELTTIRLAFVKFYPPPPSNMQAQGRYERMYGGEMPPAVIRGLWLKELKPWSDRWWSFYTDFNEIVRAKKLQKPKDKDPTITEAEAKRWAKEFHKEHGDARILAKDLPK